MPRQYCPQCHRPIVSCVCKIIEKHLPTGLHTHTRVLIIQHPKEENHPKGTGRLLHLCLPNSQLLITETLPCALEAQLQQSNSALLYPQTQESEPFIPHAGTNTDTQLIILDGTWRKTRKLLHLNAGLRQLPRLSLEEAHVGPSNYRIRKAHKSGQLATIEAAALALQLVEPCAHEYQGLRDTFNGFIDFKESEQATRQTQK